MVLQRRRIDNAPEVPSNYRVPVPLQIYRKGLLVCRRWFAAGVALALVLPFSAVGTAFAQAAEPAAAAVSPQRALLDRYCVTCHNERVVAGNGRGMMAEQLRLVGLALDAADVDNVAEEPELWEKVVRKLRVGAMPPQPRSRPDKETYDGFRRWLEDELDSVAEARPNPGRTQAFHRLNRAEYRNVIRDLLDLEIDVEALIPPDAPDRNGFDNIASSLSLSPALFERYVSAAKKIGRLAIGEAPTGGAEIATYDVPLNLIQNDQQSEDLPFGSRGGAAIRHHFPVDGEYRIKVRLQTNYVGYIRGIDAAHQIEFRLDGQRIERFTFGGEAPGMPAPISFAGNIRGTDDWEDYTLHADDPLEGDNDGVGGTAHHRRLLPAGDVGRGGRPAAAADRLRPGHQRDAGRQPGPEQRADYRTVERRRAGGHAEPAADLYVPAGTRSYGGRGEGLRPPDPAKPRASRVPAPRGRDRRGDAARVLRVGPR